MNPRDWIDESGDCSLYEFGKGGLVEFYLDMISLDRDIAVSSYMEIHKLWETVEDLGERLVGEARENYSELL
jgi:hypothetical protein